MANTTLQLGSTLLDTDEKSFAKVLDMTQTIDDKELINNLFNEKETNHDENCLNKMKTVKNGTKINSYYEKQRKKNNHMTPQKKYDKLQRQKENAKSVIKQKKNEMIDLKKQKQNEYFVQKAKEKSVDIGWRLW